MSASLHVNWVLSESFGDVVANKLKVAVGTVMVFERTREQPVNFANLCRVRSRNMIV